MKFKDIKRRVIECLREGNIEFAVRHNVDIKNLLSTGDVTPYELIAVITRAGGDDYRVSPHHLDSRINVHIITVVCSGLSWYIKWYFGGADSIFISVHH